MGRVFLTIIIPVLLPTALYLAWRVGFGRTLNLSAAWLWLLIGGLVLAILTFLALNVDFHRRSEGIYVPPHVGDDGKMVPGHVEPAGPQPARTP